MKYRSGLLALLMSVLVATPVLGQDEEASEETVSEEAAPVINGRPYYFSLMGSFLSADKDRGIEDGMGGTLAIGKRMTDGLHLELTAHYLQADAETRAGLVDNGKLSLTGIGVTALIFPFNSYPGIYGLLSVGPGSAENHPGQARAGETPANGVPNYKTTYFDSGIGYLYPLSEKLLLRAEARYHMDAHNREKAGIQAPAKNNQTFYDGVFNIGILMPLGTPAPVEQPPEEEPVAEAGPVDSDNDGVTDDLDKCPGTPAGAVVDENGCEADTDGDGVPDREDKCPDTAAGTQVGTDGCAMDTDGDGVPDAVDECPNTPAGAKVLANGCALKDDCRTPRPGEQVDENGCAVDKAFILKGVNFEFDSDRLTPEAKVILDQVAETLSAYADVNVEIAGHTDSLGTDAYNLGLSERRSIAVKNYLTGKGVDAARMSPNGYGESQPIDTNDTEEGQSRNRRVELRVIEEENSGVTAPSAPAEPVAAESAPVESAPVESAPVEEAAPAEETAPAEAAPAEEAVPAEEGVIEPAQ